MKKKLITFTLTFALMFSGFPLSQAFAAGSSTSTSTGTSSSTNTSASSTDIQQQLDQNRQQRQQIYTNLAKNKQGQADLLKKIAAARDEVNKLQTNVDALMPDYLAKQKSADQIQQQFNRRVVFLYQKGESNYLAQMISAKSFAQFLQRLEVIRHIVKQDHALLVDRLDALDAVAKVKNKYEALINDQQKQINDAQDAFTALDKASQKDQATLKGIATSEEDDSSEIVKVNLSLIASGKLNFPFNGFLRKPSDNPEGDRFGMRYHPILHIMRMHEGIDFPGPIGSKIYAPADGVVVGSEASAGFGWLITIYHGVKDGKAVYTRYAHSWHKQVRVKVGDQVYAGEWITSEGNNGLSTGPHLHFEVHWGNGDNPPAVNPDPWFQ